MLNDHPRVSRRTLMKAAGVAPLVLAARKAFANPSPANLSAFAQVSPSFSSADMVEVLKRAKSVGLPDGDKSKFQVVVSFLWDMFELGTGGFPVQGGVRLMVEAYDYKSGATLVQKLSQFPTDLNDKNTTFCAYTCGHKAVIDVLTRNASGEQYIKLENYQNAWEKTFEEAQVVLSKARALAEKAETDPGTQNLGLGC